MDHKQIQTERLRYDLPQLFQLNAWTSEIRGFHDPDVAKICLLTCQAVSLDK